MTAISLAKGNLEKNIKLFKTKEGFVDELLYQFTTTNFDADTRANIIYNEKLKQITIPVINDEYMLTGKTEKYMFNGKYFVKMK